MNPDTRDILQVLKSLAPDLDVEAFLEQVGGRQWYICNPRRRDMTYIREAIRRDPCRDYRQVARRYKVSIATVYNIWGEKAG